MACQKLCRILQTFSQPAKIFMSRPITSCFFGFTWSFVTLKRMFEPRGNASLCSFSVSSAGLTQRSPMQNCVHLSLMRTWPFWKCWDMRTFGRGHRCTSQQATTGGEASLILTVWCYQSPGPRLNINTVFPRYGDPHVKDETVSRPSYLQHGDPHTGKTTSLYWESPHVTLEKRRH